MKVKLKKGKNFGRWLYQDVEYTVLSIEGTEYRILPADGISPALFPIEAFQITSNEIPEVWRIKLQGDKLSLMPETWCENGFWEKFFNDDSQAIQKFKRVRKILEPVESYDKFRELRF